MSDPAVSVLGDAGSPRSELANRVAVAVAGFRDGHLRGGPARPLDAADFGELLRVAEDHRLLGALAQVVQRGLLPVDDAQWVAIDERHAIWAVHSLRVERLLGRAQACLGRAGIDARVLKGVALAHLVYDDPAWRVFVDADILVPTRRFDDAVMTLQTDLGGVLPVAELRPGFDREFGKDATIRVNGVELDLHRTFVTGPFGLTIDLDSLFEAPSPFAVGQQTFHALAPLGVFLHACYEAALGDYPLRLGALRDLLLISRESPVAFGELVEVARGWRGLAVVQRAARLTCEVLGLDAGDALWRLATIDVPRREGWLLRAYLTPARSYTRPLASLAVIPGIGPRLRYARALLAPSARYLQSRGWTKRNHLRRAVRQLGTRRQ